MTPQSGTSRREFIKASARAAAGLVIGFYVEPKVRWAMAQEGAPPAAAALPAANAFVHIGTDESVTVLLAHSEMGQGIWTTLAMLVAEELECDWAKIRVEHAPAAPAYRHTAFGMQMTGGSTTTWSEFDRYRQVGALARALLVQAAAAEWKVDPKACSVQDGFVLHEDKKLSFGHLAPAAEKLPAPTEVKLKDAKDWKRIGQPTKRLDSADKVAARAQFGMDVHFPGLMTAVVERSPVFGGKVKSFKADKAKAVPGVKAVVQVPSGVAVVAEHFWAAKKGRAELEVDWDLGPGASLDTEALRAEYRATSQKPGTKAHAAGDVQAGLSGAKSVLEAEYEVPFLAHATMEPLNCTVKADANGCEIWTGTQMQTMDQMTAAMILGLKPEQVQVHTQFLGGGFGRRATPTSHFVGEAVQVAKAAGMPVKVVWTREDDMHGGYYRPMALHRLKVGVGADGMPAAWQQTIVSQSILAGTPFAAVLIKDGIDETCVEGAADSPYVLQTPNHLVELHSPQLPVPVLWWRSVGHTHTAFTMESFVDELAHAAGQDPLEYRRKLLKDQPRYLGVLNLAAEKAGWGKALPAGRARGLAVHSSFGSYVAEVAEVSVEEGKVRVHKVVCAVDCGVVVNPDGVKAQMESGIVFGLSATLMSELTFKAGEVQQSNFSNYRVLRLRDMPVVEVHLVPSTEKLGGAGEPGTPPIAPAVANAVFTLTGKRLRRLPLQLA
jgi:isoquinoline 1-oxidoreductase subunit beta